jgi:hypothetical protein
MGMAYDPHHWHCHVDTCWSRYAFLVRLNYYYILVLEQHRFPQLIYAIFQYTHQAL